MNKPHPILALLGLQAHKTGHLEKLLAAVGGFFGILVVLLISRHYLGLEGAAWIAASMGASAVLVFAVPHGPLSQPWPLLGGHVLSAFVGVSCAWLIPDPMIAAASAVALAILVMQYLRCIHPPGGATALAAVVGGDGIQALGFQYVITPVLVNVLMLILIGVLFNYPFHWRRYPTALARISKSADGGENEGA